MKNTIPEKLASLNITWTTLAALAIWFVLGKTAAGAESFSRGLSLMNQILVRDWLALRGADHPLVLGWFIVLAVLALVLGINLLFCLLRRLRQAAGSRRGAKFWVFVFMHAVFGLLMIMHGLETATGQKYPARQMLAGEERQLDSGASIRVREVIFVNDPELLLLDSREARHSIGRDEFDMQENRAVVTLSDNGREVVTGAIRMLQPLRRGHIHVVLRGFEYTPEGTAAKIRVVESFLHTPFLAAYALFIVGLAAYLVLSAGLRAAGNSSDSGSCQGICGTTRRSAARFRSEPS